MHSTWHTGRCSFGCCLATESDISIALSLWHPCSDSYMLRHLINCHSIIIIIMGPCGSGRTLAFVVIIQCLQYRLNAVHWCMQLWCATGVNINGWQQAENVASSAANSVSSAGQSDISNSAVCEHLAEKHVLNFVVAFVSLDFSCLWTLFIKCVMK